MDAPLLPFTKAQRERLYVNRPPNVGKGLALADWHRVVQFIEAAQQPSVSPAQMRWRHGEKHGFPDQWQQSHPVVLPPYWIVDGIDEQFSSPAEAIDVHMKAVAMKGGAA